MNAVSRALLMPAVATAIMFGVLVALGTWQLRRLEEKEALIARVEQRFDAPPSAPPPQAEWPRVNPLDYDFRHVEISGRYENGQDALLYAVTPSGFGSEPGFLVLTPFRVDSGGVVLVERGFLPHSKTRDRTAFAAPERPLTLTGHLRAPQSRNSFTPADDAGRNVWFTRDAAAMSVAMGIKDAAPFTLSLDGGGVIGAEKPRPVSAKPEYPNNHLSYAFTWFSLALVDVIIFAFYARGVMARARQG